MYFCYICNLLNTHFYCCINQFNVNKSPSGSPTKPTANKAVKVVKSPKPAKRVYTTSNSNARNKNLALNFVVRTLCPSVTIVKTRKGKIEF